MTHPLTLTTDTLERTLGRRYGDVRRWRPIDPDVGALVDVHDPPEIGTRGSGARGLARVVGEVRVPFGIRTPIAPDRIAERFDRVEQTVRSLYGDDLEAARRIIESPSPRPATRAQVESAHLADPIHLTDPTGDELRAHLADRHPSILELLAADYLTDDELEEIHWNDHDASEETDR